MTLKVIYPTLLVALLAGFFGGAASSRQSSAAPAGITSIQFIRTQGVEVIDRTGKVRIGLSTNPQTGAAMVSMFDPSNNSPHIIIGTQIDGSSNIQMSDSSGNKRASLDLLANGAVRLALTTAASQGGIVLGTGDKSALVFRDNSNRVRAAVGLDGTDSPTVAIYDESNKVIWTAPPTNAN